MKSKYIQKTAINPDEKIDLIEHINDDHADEILAVAQLFAKVDAKKARVVDIFHEGFDVEIDDGEVEKSIFIPFLIDGKIEEKILYLAYKSMVKSRQMMKGTKNHYFKLIKTQKISKNMLRLILYSEQALPNKKAGYAYLFMLKILKRNKHYQDKEFTKMSLLMKWWFSGLLVLMKWMKAKSREYIMLSMFQGQRYYTLRSSHPQENEDTEHHIAYIDIYTHNNSAGSVWCNSLVAGDIIHSTCEIAEKTEHLKHGQTLLLADETALPALAGICEDWRNPIPPIVILITSYAEEQDYIKDDILPENTILHRITLPQNQQLSAVLAKLQHIDKLDNVWGATEGGDAKAIRKYIREHFQLSGKSNRIKGYWLLKAESK